MGEWLQGDGFEAEPDLVVSVENTIVEVTSLIGFSVSGVLCRPRMRSGERVEINGGDSIDGALFDWFSLNPFALIFWGSL